MRPDACDVSEMRAVRPVVKDEGRIDNLRERVKKRRRGNRLLQRGEGGMEADCDAFTDLYSIWDLIC